VKKLTHPYEQRNHILFCDNLFTSPQLVDELERVGIYFCGTCRFNRRGLPPTLREVAMSLDSGQEAHWQKGNLGCLLWKHRRLVCVLANYERVDKKVDNTENEDADAVTLPRVVSDYNKNKGGVDKIDQLRQYYAIGRKSLKNWRALFAWLLDMAILNSYRLFLLKSDTKVVHLEFRRRLALQIKQEFLLRPRVQQVNVSPVPPNGLLGHFPVRIGFNRWCKQCSTGVQERKKRSEFQCNACKVPLCIGACYALYHNDTV
jgi:hypothetical protein